VTVAKAATAKATGVGDDWNKARTVDLMIGINATDVRGRRRGTTSVVAAVAEHGDFDQDPPQDRQKMQFLTKVIGRV
jgi:replicative DNA helicase